MSFILIMYKKYNTSFCFIPLVNNMKLQLQLNHVHGKKYKKCILLTFNLDPAISERQNQRRSRCNIICCVLLCYSVKKLLPSGNDETEWCGFNKKRNWLYQCTTDWQDCKNIFSHCLDCFYIVLLLLFVRNS